MYTPNLHFYSDVDDYLSICEQVIHKYGEMDQTIMHCIFLGAAGVGKSSLMKRLLHMKLGPNRTSTPLAEKSVRVEVRDVATTVAQVSGLDWQIMKDPGKQACGLMGQMLTKQEKESKEENKKEFKRENQSDTRKTKTHEPKGETGEHVFKQNGESPIKQGKVLKENYAAMSGLSTQIPEQQESEFDGSQVTASPTDVSEHPKLNSQPFQFSRIDFFRRVLNEEGISGLKQHISKLNPWILYLTDSGGQPEFQELLPALVVGPCIFILVFPLDKDMTKKYKVEYVRGAQENMKTYTSSFNLQEDLMQSLASIASTKYKDKDGKEVQPRVMLVATFVDKVPQKDRQTKLDNIKALVKGTDAYRLGMIVDASRNQMVFTINNVSDEEAISDSQKIRDAFQKIAQFFRVPTPYPWLVFSILVQHVYGNDKSVISNEECFKVAQECGIQSEKDYQAALQFLHKQTGLLHYYKQPSDLNQIVIRDPQHLFGRVSKLVQETFVFDKTHSGKCRDDFEKGIFTKEDYEMLTKDSTSMLTPSMLLKLLEHLKVVVPLVAGEKYFMPCAISHLDESSSCKFPQSATIPPLLITFKSGYCPKGLFGALVACIANKQVANCKLNLDEAKIHRDQICFTMGQYDLFMRVNPAHIYIEIIPYNAGTPLPKLCNQCNSVRRLILENIEIACATLHYSDNANYCLSFECPCNQNEWGGNFHLAVLRDDLNYCFLCTQTKKVVDVEKRCYMWLPQPTIIKMVPKEQLVAHATEAKFKVEATGDCLQFQWKKDCKELHDGSKYRGTNTDTLRIKNVEKSDNGCYQCLVKNNGEELSNEAELTIVDPPKVTRHPESKSVVTGTSAVFTVEATGDELQFQWQKDGKDIDRNESRLQHSQTDKTSTLHIQRVEKRDRGHYTCLVKNPVEVNGKVSHMAELTAFDPPKVTRHPESKSVVTGTSAVFTVEATGDELQFQWQKDGKDIDRNESRLQHSQTDKTSTLHIQRVEKRDRGHYKCLVKDAVEKSEDISDEAELIISQNWKKTGSIIFILVLVLLGIVSGAWWLIVSEVVDCGTLPDPVYGQVSHMAKTTLGQTATYSCNPGYKPVGDNIRICHASGDWSGSAPTCQPQLPGSPFSLDDPPALDALRNFPVKNRHSDIAAEIGPDYEKFGTLLLEDKTGYKIKIIRMQEHNDPLRITIEILQQWLQGKGRKPVVWQTLVKCLQETGLEVLADNMKHSLSEHDRSKNPDRVHSEEL